MLKMKLVTAVISFVFFVGLLHSSNCIKCYECHSTINVGCDKIIDDQYLIDCPDNSSFSCGVIHYKDAFIDKFVSRRCLEQSVVETFESKTCSTDKCNGNDGVVATNNMTAGDRIKCYSCKSERSNLNPQCEQLVDEKYLIYCEMDEVCMKYAFFNSDKTLKFMKRGCVHKSSQFIKTCNTDRCNGHEFNMN